MNVLDDIEIPTIEISEGWAVDDVKTIKDCDDARDYLTAALAGIEYQIEAEGFKPLQEQRGPWVAAAKSALRYKKAAMSIVQSKRAELNERRRAVLEKEREDGLLAFIRSVVPPQQWLAWVTAHDAAPGDPKGGRMSFIDRLFRPSPQPTSDIQRSYMTGQFMPSQAECKRRSNAVSVRLEFEMLKLHTPPDQYSEAVKRGGSRSNVRVG